MAKFDIDTLDADQFSTLAAQVGRLFGALREAGVLEEISKHATKAENMSDAEANAFVMQLIGDSLPKLLETNSDAVYSVIAACKGQTLAEYREKFTVRGTIQDVKDLIEFLSGDGLGFLFE